MKQCSTINTTFIGSICLGQLWQKIIEQLSKQTIIEQKCVAHVPILLSLNGFTIVQNTVRQLQNNWEKIFNLSLEMCFYQSAFTQCDLWCRLWMMMNIPRSGMSYKGDYVLTDYEYVLGWTVLLCVFEYISSSLKHWSNSTSEQLKRTKLKEWPSHSPILNLIEMMWQDLNRAVHAWRATNLSKLKQFCKEEWAQVPSQWWAGLISNHI